MIIANIKYNKTSFLNRWKKIIKDHRLNEKLVTKNLEFIRGSCKITDRYKKYGYAAKFEAKIGEMEFGPKGKSKKIRGIMIRTLNHKSYIFISQNDIMRELFPPKTDEEIGKKNRAEVLQAMRQLIRPQIEEFREGWMNKMNILKDRDIYEYHEAMKCPLSGKDLRKGDIAIDHDIPFIDLVRNFWRLNGVDPFTENIIGGVYSRKFERSYLNKAWIEYHRKNAILQVADATANKKKNKKTTEEFLELEKNARQAKSKPRTLIPSNDV